MKVLIVGGGICRLDPAPALEKEHDCRYFDIRPVEGAEGRTTVADVHDDAAVAAAMAGTEAVVYLAMGKGANAPDNASAINDVSAAFSVNVAAVYRFLATASATTARCENSSTPARSACITGPSPSGDTWTRRFRRTGSIRTRITQAHRRRSVPRRGPAFPACDDPALRLVLPKNDNEWPYEHENKESLASNCATGPERYAPAVPGGAACDKPGFHVMQCSGDLTGKKIPNDRAREILGWSPEGN